MKYFLLVLVLCVIFGNDALAKKRHKKSDRNKSHNHINHKSHNHGNHKSHNHKDRKSHGNKIVGGEDATIEDYKYMAYMMIDDEFECGGCIISSSYIITAAHCFQDAQSATARIGSTDKDDGGHEYTGTFEYHPDYDADYLDYDIAYFKSDEEMELDDVTAQAIKIIDEGQSIPSGTVLKIAGWGDTSDGGDDSDTLRAVEVPSMTTEECNNYSGFGLTVRQFCAGYPEGGKDHCDGDSGGPAVIADSNEVAGIISGSLKGCGEPDAPGIYVNLTDPAIRSWIAEKTGI